MSGDVTVPSDEDAGGTERMNVTAAAGFDPNRMTKVAVPPVSVVGPLIAVIEIPGVSSSVLLTGTAEGVRDG
jgi:hypothetical protein